MTKNTIYIIRYDGMGDSLWVEPILDFFCRNYHKVVFITHHPLLFKNYPHKNIILKYRLSKAEKILLFISKFIKIRINVFDLNKSYETKPRQHILKSYLQDCGIDIELRYPKIYLDKEENKISNKKYVVLHLENSLGKNYRNVYGINWNLISKHLSDAGYEVLQIGKDNRNIQNSIYKETNNLRSLISLINKAKIFIGMDSGPSHIAASLKIPSLIFFGSVNSEYRHLNSEFKGLILQQNCEYAGCYHDVISHTGQTCKLVGDKGIPKCCLHTNEYVIKKIDLLIEKYKLI